MPRHTSTHSSRGMNAGSVAAGDDHGTLTWASVVLGRGDTRLPRSDRPGRKSGSWPPLRPRMSPSPVITGSPRQVLPNARRRARRRTRGDTAPLRLRAPTYEGPDVEDEVDQLGRGQPVAHDGLLTERSGHTDAPAWCSPARASGCDSSTCDGQLRFLDLLRQVLRSILDCSPRSMTTGTCCRTLPSFSHVSVQFSIRPGTSSDDTVAESNSVAVSS